MKKNVKNKSINSDFLDLIINDIFFEKDFLNQSLFTVNPFFSYFEQSMYCIYNRIIITYLVSIITTVKTTLKTTLKTTTYTTKYL